MTIGEGQKQAMLEMRIVLVLLVSIFQYLQTPTDVSTYEAEQKFTRPPRKCYVALKKI